MPGTPRLPRAARRIQIVETAAGAFLRGGYDGTSMDDVADAAGVSRLILYRIFDSKPDLYRAVLRAPLDGLAEAFAGLSPEQVRERGASMIILPVARAHPDGFRLVWRHAWSEPDFADMAIEFRNYVTNFARTLLTAYLDDEVVLNWASRAAGAHLMEAICTWLDVGDPARDHEVALMIRSGIRAMAGAWASGPD